VTDFTESSSLLARVKAEVSGGEILDTGLRQIARVSLDRLPFACLEAGTGSHFSGTMWDKARDAALSHNTSPQTGRNSSFRHHPKNEIRLSHRRTMNESSNQRGPGELPLFATTHRRHGN
jgi:hypothetical protein